MNTSARIVGIEYHLPGNVLTNEDLAREFPDWTASKIETKLGIRSRHVAGKDECASDLAVAAAGKLFRAQAVKPEEIDYILYCTQSPDYILPSTACLIQDRLGLPVSCGALDFNLGCSGFVYGLGLAKGLLESGQARHLLLLTADTYTKYLDPSDKANRAIFGDGATATLLRADPVADEAAPLIGPFVSGTDGQGAGKLMIRAGGCRHPLGPAGGGTVSDPFLRMDGPAIFTFTLERVSKVVPDLLSRAGLSMADVDYFVFHQANRYMLDYLRSKIGIPEDRFLCHMQDCGNTVSSTIPIVLSEAARSGTLRRGMRVMVVGFGVGLSWSAALLRW